MIKIIAIGRKHDTWIASGLERYQKRLQKPWDIKWDLLPHSSQSGPTARQEESRRILDKLKPDDYVILLDERGNLLDSPTLSRQIEQLFTAGKTPTLIIGGAYGVDEKLTSRADLLWSLSPLVFPHQLVRLMLVEQLYRSQQIATGGSYHHE